MRTNLTLLFLFILSSSCLIAQEEGFEFVNPPITIVVLGSSTAEGMGTWPLDSAWVNRFRVYVQSFNPENRVINLAKGGFDTYNILPTDSVYARNRPVPDTTRNFTKALQYKPDGIIINLPSNDVANGYSIEEQLTNFRYLSELSAANGIELWVATTQARNFPRERDRQIQRDIKDSLQTIFSSNCIDFWSEFCDERFRILKQYDYGDGCHMNNSAHKVLADRVIESQAFRRNLYETSFLREIPNKNPEELSPHLLSIGFKGKVEFDSEHENLQRFVKIIQEDRVLNAVEVSKAKYDIRTIIDLRFPVKLEFEAPYSLTKVVEFSFDEMVQSKEKPSNYYPIEDLSMTEILMEELNYKFPNASFTVAKFRYDSTRLEVRLNTKHVSQQRQRIEDASITSPTKGNKIVVRWKNGNKKSVLKFKNGQLTRKSKWYQENGKKERTVNFRNGRYHGKHIEFNAEGKKKSRRIFANDKQVGETKTFD